MSFDIDDPSFETNLPPRRKKGNKIKRFVISNETMEEFDLKLDYIPDIMK